MNDRYLFKAKRKNWKELPKEEWWIKGYLYRLSERHPPFIMLSDRCGESYEIDVDTICQSTGLKDKHGNLIWENDVVFVTDDNGCSGQVDTGLGEIIFLEGLWYISGRVQNGLYDINKCFQIEVIGSLIDNPELVEVEHDERENL